MRRTLTVRRERLAELTTDDLLAVNGAGPDAPPTRELRDCARTVFGCTTAITCPRPD